MEVQSFGAWYRSERVAAKKTQKDVAKETGIHKIHISKIENGHSGTTPETVHKLVEAIGADVSIGLKLAGFASSVNTSPADADLLEMAPYWSQLNNKDRERVKRIVRDFAAA